MSASEAESSGGPSASAQQSGGAEAGANDDDVMKTGQGFPGSRNTGGSSEAIEKRNGGNLAGEVEEPMRMASEEGQSGVPVGDARNRPTSAGVRLDAKTKDAQPQEQAANDRSDVSLPAGSTPPMPSSPGLSGADAATVLTAEQRPIEAESSGPTSAKPSVPHMDLGTYPTPELLKILASLLQQIAIANDALRPPPSPAGEDSEISAGGAVGAGRDIAQGSESRSPPAGNATFGNGGRREDPPATLSASPTQHTAPPARKTSRGSMVDSMVIPPFRPKHGSAAGSGSSNSAKAPDQAQPTRSASTSSPSTGSAAMVSASNTSLSASGSASVTSPTTPSSSRNNHTALGPIPPIPRHSGNSSTSSTPGGTQFTTTAARKSIMHPSAILCFHARNVPSISIEAYLQRILKYCPITNEVFLSLLIYFDRMSRTHYGDLATGGDGTGSSKRLGSSASSQTLRGFAIDSFNVHRLVIAGITVASKFFSDIFYTNSRYAKVGGLPQTELNQLELQFLLLNDFNLQIPLEEMQRYADQLLVYWSNKSKDGDAPAAGPPGSTSSPESVVRSESGRGDKRKRQESVIPTADAASAERGDVKPSGPLTADSGISGSDGRKDVECRVAPGSGSPMAVDGPEGED